MLKFGAHRDPVQDWGIAVSPPGLARYASTAALLQLGPRPPAQSPLPVHGQERPAATAYWYMTLLDVFPLTGAVMLRMASLGGGPVSSCTCGAWNAFSTLWRSTIVSVLNLEKSGLLCSSDRTFSAATSLASTMNGPPM